MTTVYLCGGINGLNDAQCKDWREVAKSILTPTGVATLDPMRRDYRGKEADSVTEIVEGDLDDIRRSDVVLVNASRASWGTAMEVVYAFVKKNPPRIYAFGAGDKPSPWLVFHCRRLFATVEEACEWIKTELYERGS
jgi:nucleoside 2-deoxyribosyltransferase